MQIEYSLSTIEIGILNLAGILITGIIPGIDSGDPKRLEPYMELLVKELLSLQNFKLTNSSGEVNEVSTKLLSYVLNFLAIGKDLHLPGSRRSFQAHPFCKRNEITCKVCWKTLALTWA